MLTDSSVTPQPITVYRGSMRVVDGMSGQGAAILQGQDEIEVRFFDGSEEAAFVMAVERNITHGPLLALADWTAVAARIGRDGCACSLNPAAGHKRAGELIRSKLNALLWEISSETGYAVDRMERTGATKGRRYRHGNVRPRTTTYRGLSATARNRHVTSAPETDRGDDSAAAEIGPLVKVQ
jgi:hypothetical protein